MFGLDLHRILVSKEEPKDMVSDPKTRLKEEYSQQVLWHARLWHGMSSSSRTESEAASEEI